MTVVPVGTVSVPIDAIAPPSSRLSCFPLRSLRKLMDGRVDRWVESYKGEEEDEDEEEEEWERRRWMIPPAQPPSGVTAGLCSTSARIRDTISDVVRSRTCRASDRVACGRTVAA